MTGLLSKAGSKLTLKQLLDTLAETMEFEASVVKKYSTPVSSVIQVFMSWTHQVALFAAARHPKSDHSSQCDAPVKTDHVRV